ncbi:MAG: hypothetical protein M1820_007739 [Bogoriella megaspora]|nr:MAG: hypothetical protein M1820_007739 [Bogoriella megaspora]
MEDVPPTYELSTTREYWTIIARYVQSSDLRAAALVSRRWHEIFVPYLWGNPASHFSVEDDSVYVALVRFKKTLPWARYHIRELTHTLHLPPAHAQLYGGPHPEWLRDILERLPRLQSLIVDKLPFFDHGTLCSLRYFSKDRNSLPGGLIPTFPLRLLSATSCSNVTSTGLAEALRHFPQLVSLDLSGTRQTRHDAVFWSFHDLRVLKVLKIRGIHLRNEDLEKVVKSVGTRIRSLDIRDNLLTDRSIRLLLEHCFKDLRSDDLTAWSRSRSGSSCLSGDRPSGLPNHLGSDILDDYEGEELDLVLRRGLTKKFSGHLLIEDALETGVTHLYISGNKLTVEDVSGLLRSRRLHVLDAGSLTEAYNNLHSTTSVPFEVSQDFKMPGVEKLVPLIMNGACRQLRYLRINHSLVTRPAPPFLKHDVSPELEGNLAIHKSPTAQELDAHGEQRVELPREGADRVELPAHSVRVVLTPAAGESPKLTEEGEAHLKIRRGSGACSPELVLLDETPDHNHRAAIDSPTPLTPPLSPESLISTQPGALTGISSLHNYTQFSSSVPSPFLDLLSANQTPTFPPEHQARLSLQQSQSLTLHPSSLPQLRTLVLTDVPSQSSNPETAALIITFITSCASCVSLARLTARTAYVLPPNRNRAVAEKEYAYSLFPLKKIVLELEDPSRSDSHIEYANHTRTMKRQHSGWHSTRTQSSTEDPDSEAFWSASANDFSFFSDEECGVPDLDPDHSPVPIMAMREKASSPPSITPVSEQASGKAEQSDQPMYNVIATVAKFRREKKEAYARAVEVAKASRGGKENAVVGEVEVDVEGYWPGEIQVVRPVARSGDGETDWYGNLYEKGHNYR